jgi:hypothetical protein
LESTRARLIELFEDATAQLREGSIPFPRNRRATSSNGEKIAYANVHLACWNGPVKFEFAVPDAATDHQLLESTRARLIELFEDATAQLREGSIPFP